MLAIQAADRRLVERVTVVDSNPRALGHHIRSETRRALMIVSTVPRHNLDLRRAPALLRGRLSSFESVVRERCHYLAVCRAALGFRRIDKECLIHWVYLVVFVAIGRAFRQPTPCVFGALMIPTTTSAPYYLTPCFRRPRRPGVLILP